MDYQIYGSQCLAARNRFGLHDEMGIGKTATTIGAIDLLNAERGVVICPAMLRENWIGEFRKFSDRPRRIVKAMNIHDYTAWKRGRFHIMVASYEMATKWAKDMERQGECIDFVAMDEAHYLKNSRANRTSALLGPDLDGWQGLISWAKHSWHITGTPMANDPLDIYTFLRMCFALDMSEEAFIKRYFFKHRTTYGSRQEPRPEMVPELKALIENNSLRRTKREVQPQLPPIFLTSTLVDGDTEQLVQFLREYPHLDAAIILALEQGGLSFLDAQHIATLRRLIGEAKAPGYAQMVVDELRQSYEKRVIYGLHRDAMTMIRDELMRNGIGAVLVNGDTSEAQRKYAVEAFQGDAACRVFLGQIRAAGVGITLTAACEIDIFESDWSPAGNAQAIMRVHRIGQARKVRARFITLARTLDEVVNRIVAAKTAAIAQIEGEAMHAAPLDVLNEYLVTS